MTLTKTQIFHRTDDLSGEIKAAREALSECVRDAAEKQRLAAIAVQAVDRANERLDLLATERRTLAELAKEVILQVGDPPPLAIEDGPAPEMIAGSVDCWRCPDCSETMLAADAPKHVCFANATTISVFWGQGTAEGADFQAQAMANGEAKMNEALDRSREGWG